MADTRSTSQEVQTEILDAVRKSQEAMVDAIKRWAETVQSITPSMPILPYTSQLPKPEEFVANAYDFAEQLLASQREFAVSVLHATTPMLAPKNGNSAGKSGSQTK